MSGPYREPWIPQPEQVPRPQHYALERVMSALLSTGCTLAILAWSGTAKSDARMACAILAGGAVGIGLGLAVHSLGDRVYPR